MDAVERGRFLRRARRRRGMSQAVLAGLVGRSESWLSQVERGLREIDSHRVLSALAEVLRVDIAELIGEGTRRGHASRLLARSSGPCSATATATR
jgi:transcriptional regulator with XRE-family HTH domain